jgi:hypothetical protein
MIYAAYHAYKWTWPGNLPEEGPINTCIEFYRRELESQRDYSHRCGGRGCAAFPYVTGRGKAPESQMEIKLTGDSGLIDDRPPRCIGQKAAKIFHTNRLTVQPCIFNGLGYRIGETVPMTGRYRRRRIRTKQCTTAATRLCR